MPVPVRRKARNKGEALARPLCHADIDGGLDLDLVRAIEGAFAVSSGTPGHGHVYVALTESVTEAQHEMLCRWLGERLGHADNKVSDNDVLRPPGTLNWKPTVDGGQPLPVVWAVKP